MGRLTLKAKLGATEPVLRGRGHYWEVMRAIGKGGHRFSAADVAARCNKETGSLHRFMKELVAGGILARAGEATSARGRAMPLYILTVRPADLPITGGAKQGRCQQLMWNTIRGPVCRKGFTAAELASYASTDEAAIAPVTARTYVQRLADAGYLVRLGTGTPQIWTLKPSMNTGPKAPAVLTGYVVFDRNHMRTVGELVATEAA